MAILSTKNLRRGGAVSTVTGRLSKFGFKFWFIPIMVVVLGVVGWWTRSAIEETLKDRIEQNLVTILDTEVKALEYWLESKRDAATVLADRSFIRGVGADLAAYVAQRGDSRAAVRGIVPNVELRDFLDTAMEQYGFSGYGFVTRNGVLLATYNSENNGVRFDPEQMPDVEAAFNGETRVSNPFRATFLESEGGSVQAGDAIMLVLAPVRDEDEQVILTLGFAINVDEFSSVLGIARAGETGETYAIDDAGVLLSNSRFEDTEFGLRDIGLLPEDTEVDSILNVEIRNPGGDMTKGFEPDTLRRAQPLTLAAASLVSGESGANVEGYPDYRGVPVVGAWRWLDRYEFGVITEQDYDEAYEAITTLRGIQMFLIGLLVVAGIAMMIESVVISRLGKKVTEAVMEARQLGQYTLDKKIGSGGMGEVYRASHAMLRRPTAVKLLRPDRASETDIARFEREVQLTAGLTHPNTIAIFDFGRTPDNVFYYAMEYLNGIDLQDLVDQAGPQDAGRVIYILQQACGSLSEAHGIGLIHRDIKPANIILCDRGGDFDVVKVVDFGIVKDIGSSVDTQLTQAGAFSGTPLYIAPETIRASDEVDARVDVYALGAVGYFLLTGRTIFPDDLSGVDILTRQLNEMPAAPSSISEVPVPGDLEQLVMRCLAKEPDERPASTAEMLDLLTELSDAGRWGRREAKRWWAVHTELAGFSTSGGDTADQSQTAKTMAIAMQERAEETVADEDQPAS